MANHSKRGTQVFLFPFDMVTSKMKTLHMFRYNICENYVIQKNVDKTELMKTCSKLALLPWHKSFCFII